MSKILLVSIIIAVVAIGTAVFIKTTTPAPPRISAPLTQGNCATLEAQVKDLIDKANRCNEDTDCAASSPNFLVCPFGCYLLLNKDADTKPIEAGIKNYTQNCQGCLYECPYFPEPDDIKCINRKCVDIRFEEPAQTPRVIPDEPDKQGKTVPEGKKCTTNYECTFRAGCYCGCYNKDYRNEKLESMFCSCETTAEDFPGCKCENNECTATN